MWFSGSQERVILVTAWPLCREIDWSQLGGIKGPHRSLQVLTVHPHLKDFSVVPSSLGQE